jgi:hypothetical protein
MLFEGQRFYLNGEMALCAGEVTATLKKLADYRQLQADDLAVSLKQEDLSALFYAWFLAGYLHFSE